MADNDKPDDAFLDMDMDEAFEQALEQGDDPILLAQQVYTIWGKWGDFHLYISTPVIPPINPPLVIQPELISENEYEYVYPIVDSGYKLSTSKALEMYTAGNSMCKLYYTIEKMIAILIERLDSSGVDMETEVQIAFDGYLNSQRKAFESVINLPHNVVVTNFEPGDWGEQYLKTVKLLANKGYGYPPESPRTNYKQSHQTQPPSMGG